MPGQANAWDTKIFPKLEQIKCWARDGYTDAKISEALGINQYTFIKYKKLKPILLDALKVNKEMADQTVENSLFKRANGFTYAETCIKQKRDPFGKLIHEETTRTIKTVLPDTTAGIFWLKNRKPEQWRDAWKVEHSGTVNNKINLSKEEIGKILKDVLKDDDC
jgi:hypothetical protein